MSHSVNSSRFSSSKKRSIFERQSADTPGVSLHPLFQGFKKFPFFVFAGASILNFYLVVSPHSDSMFDSLL